MYIQCCISRMYSNLNIDLPILSGDEAITETEKEEVEAIIAELNAKHMN
jgi:type IV pilus biogenesis protein CpaD/CtpE